MKRFFVVALLALALGAPGARASHGTWWLARGSTTAGPRSMPTVVRWTPAPVLAGSNGQIRIELYDAATGRLLHADTFRAREDLSAQVFRECEHLVNPYKVTSLVPSQFVLDGVMRRDTCTGTAMDDFAGTYLGLRFEVAVRGLDHG